MVMWTKEQQEAIEKSGSNILVAAAAGSGKTAVLVERIIQKLIAKENPLHIDEILVATFTNAAAEEMRSRIGKALEEAIAEDPGSYHLKKQLSLLQRASISTLHSFCTSVVRQYAYLLDIDPSFRIADEMEIDLIKQEIIDDMFEEAYGQEGEALERFFAVVDMFSDDRSDVDVEQLILSLYTFAMQDPWPEKWLRRVAETYRLPEECTETDLPWLDVLKEEVEDRLLSSKEAIDFAIQIANESDGPYHYLDALYADQEMIDKALSASDNWDELQQFISTNSLKRLSGKKVDCSEEKKAMVKKLRDRFRDSWNKMKKEWFSRNLAGHIDDMRKLHPAIEEITELVLEFKARYSAVKKERAILDFGDLEHYCLRILIEPSSMEERIIPSEIAKQYKSQFKEVLVDEYQDINLVQETILSVVSDQEGNGNMFMVGDVKQSIYRFRHAEPKLFIDKYKRFAEDESLGKRIDLAKNFRSREDVLTGANYIFRQIFDEALGEIDYDERAELVYGNYSYEDFPLQNSDVELLVIDRDQEAEKEDQEEEAEDVEATQLEARAYAKMIKEWIGKTGKPPVQVIDKTTNKPRNLQFRDIVILQRSLTGAPTIVDELKKQGIPVYAELRTGYFAAIEIQVMLNVLKLIDNPYQDIPLASVLRSPIVGLNEEQLAQIRLMNRHEPFYRALLSYAKENKEASGAVRMFLEQLKTFRDLAREGALSDLIWHIYSETGYYDFVGGIPGGRQRQANLRALYDRARGYESTSFRGLFRFLRFIERMQEQNKDLGEARALSEQEDVVRLMTIHKSKGLEFPVVILGGMSKEFNFQDLRKKYILDKDLGFATKFIDPEKRIMYPTLYYLSIKEAASRKLLAEEMRVLYVAMTRAKEKLIMVGNSASFEKKADKWLESLESREWVLPRQLRKRAKTYLDWIGPALIRHQHADGLRGPADLPEEIYKDRSKWNIEVLPAIELKRVEKEEQLTKQEVQSAIVEWKSPPYTDESQYRKIDEILSFRYPFEEAANTRAKQSVTEIKRRQEAADEYSDRRYLAPFRAPLLTRPRFMQEEKVLTAAEIGTAMHTVMQHIPLKKKWAAEEINVFLDQLVNEEKLTIEEADAIDVQQIENFFASDIARLIAESERVEREVPFTYTLDADEVYAEWQSDTNEKVLIQGVIDCIIYTEGGLIVLDYKTDRISEVTDETIENLKQRYIVQVDLYRRALGDILNEQVKETYLHFFSKNLTLKL